MKKWADREGINDARIGFVNNYALVLMVLHYLQAGSPNPVVPNLQRVFPTVFSKLSDPIGLEYDDDGIFDGLKESENANSVAELLAGFFAYFSIFPFHKEWISISEGGRKFRDELDPTTTRFLMFIEDPFEEKNTARCVLEQKNLVKIVESFRKACDALREGPSLEKLGF